MKTVVTGGAGFIGSHLVKRLLDKGRDTVIADDFSMGNKRNLLDLGIQVNYKKIDLRDFRQTLKILKDVDIVFHLAARVGGIEYLHGSQGKELKALQENLVIDANVFRACLENKVKKIIYASSVSVYPIDIQKASGIVLSEDISYIDPEGGYGWAKLVGEIALGWTKDIKIGIARIFNIYGENEYMGRDAHVIPDLIQKVIKYSKGDFVVWGNGRQSRDFLHASDCVEALLKLEEKANNPPLIINIGSGEEVYIKTIAEKIVKLSRKNIKITYDPTKPVGPMSRTADIKKAKKLLNWQPKINLDEGLRRTYVWIEERFF